jgi:uncharacterized protein (TIGR03437 family)
MKRLAFILGLSFAALAQQHSTVPVVLVDGYDFTGKCSAPRDITTNFGQLAQMLARDSGKQPLYYDYCKSINITPWSPATVAVVGRNLGQVIAAQGGRVDVIAYSTGGLFVRAYLAGLGDPGDPNKPLAAVSIRKLVLIGSPNFGIAAQLASGVNGGMINGASPIEQLLPNSGEVLPWSPLIWRLNTWNQRGDDLGGVDTVAIAGKGDSVQATDGLVSVNSASVGFAFPDGDQRTRVIPYCHGSILLGSCNGGFIANVTGLDHPSYQIIRSFLDGTDAWRTIGVSASQASKTGGILSLLDGVLAGCLDSGCTVRGTAPTLSSSAESRPLLTSPTLSAQYYMDFVPSSPATISYNDVVWNTDVPLASQGWVAPREKLDVTIRAGAYQLVLRRQGSLHASAAQVSNFGIRPSAGLPPDARSVAPDSLISIYGQNLAASTASAPYPWPIQLEGTSVTLDWDGNGGANISGTPCPITYVSPAQVNAKLPAGLASGLHSLTIRRPLLDEVSGATGRAQDTIPFMIEPIVPALFALAGNTAAALHTNYQVVSASYPAMAGEYISLYATGLGKAQNNGLVVNSDVQVFIDGQTAKVTFVGRAPGYQGLDQINVQVPSITHHGTSVPVVVVTSSGLLNPLNRTSNTVLLPIN